MDLFLPDIDPVELEKIKRENIDSIYQDEDLHDFIVENNLDKEFVKKYLYYFVKFKKENECVKTCVGPSTCKKKNSHLLLSLKYDKRSHSLSFGYKKCKYEIEIDKLKKKYLTRQFPNDYLYFKFKETLDHFAVERLPTIKKLNEYQKNPTSKGFYLSGSKEVGKSFILALFSVFLARREDTHNISFIDCPNEFKSLEYQFNNDLDYFNYYLDEMKKVQYLFLDDLGKEYKSEFVLKNILLPIVKYRCENNLPIFISSNYSLSEVKKAYSFNNETYSIAKDVYEILKNNVLELKINGLPFNVLK